MTAEYWLLVVFGAVVALAVGFFVGRRSAPTQQRLDAMEHERDEALQEAERVQGEVARHFEQSARMFGRLADDYRSFFEHFAQTAQNLGLSEGRARELLHQADPRLVADQSATGNPGTGSDPIGVDSDLPAVEPGRGSGREGAAGAASAAETTAEAPTEAEPTEAEPSREESPARAQEAVAAETPAPEDVEVEEGRSQRA